MASEGAQEEENVTLSALQWSSNDPPVHWTPSTGPLVRESCGSSASLVGEAAIQGEQTIDGPRGVENIPSVNHEPLDVRWRR